MKVLVVYESMFGNTKTVGDAVAEGLGETAEVVVGTVDDIAPAQAADASLIVVGGPTHNRGMAKPDARTALARRGSKHGTVLAGRESLRAWLDRLPAGRADVATFDTRFDKPTWIVGSAAKAAARQLSDKGYHVIGTQSFFVKGNGGPLADGGRDRAVAYGRELAARMKPAVAGAA